MLSRAGSAVLLLCPTLLSITFLITAILHLFELGKSKTRIKKETQSIPLIEKVSLKGYVDRCEHHKKTANLISKFYLDYLIVVIIGVTIILLSFLITSLCPIAEHFGLVKFLSLDAPFLLFCIFQTKHDRKHGGVTWKWSTK